MNEIDVKEWFNKHKSTIFIIIAALGYLTLAGVLLKYNNLVEEYITVSNALQACRGY